MARQIRNPSETAVTDEPVRLDKWLWAARFFKTRTLAATAVKGGKVHINARRAKASTHVQPGDCLTVTKGEVVFEISVAALADKRGPAGQAQRLYSETQASVAAREQRAEERRAARASMVRPDVRPNKKQRRQLRRFKQGR